MSEQRLFPIQTHEVKRHERDGGCKVPESVYMRAYEVYCDLYGPQQAMIDLEGRGCRGGFGLSELVAFLYAASFDRKLWQEKVEEAFRGLYL